MKSNCAQYTHTLAHTHNCKIAGNITKVINVPSPSLSQRHVQHADFNKNEKKKIYIVFLTEPAEKNPL